VGTIRFVVQGADEEGVRAALRGHAGLDGVADAEDGAVTARVGAGVHLRVRLASDEEWGDALVEETGSSAHLKEVARHAGRKKRARVATEEAWYSDRGLEWIPPELREGRGEVEAAAAEGLLPELVTLEQIRGDLHMHTTASDGANTLAEMVRAARARGYQYIAITDHSQSLKITNGLDEKRLRKQMAEIDRLNARLKGFRVLKGSEVDILKDGSLDFPDSVLRDLDVVICSVHSRFATPKAAQTERIIRAIENPHVTCVGHLTGRLLLKRPGYELDVDRVLRAVKANGKALEINSSPDRLDISDETAMRARAMGIPLLINTDAHSVRELDFMRLGVQQARRGWQSAETVLNTLSLAKFLKWRAGARRGSKAVGG
jgi:DNA polymerase (family 10)